MKNYEINMMADDSVNEIIGYIKERRTSLGIGQPALSEMSGVDQGYISRIERGLVKRISFGHVVKLIGALNGKMIVSDA